MIKTLRENYHQLVGRLTYRQRYVILGLLFFIFVPIPTYFAFKALNFYSQNNAMQRMGITYQRAISALFTHALEYERSKTSGTSQIAEDFDQLKAVEEAGSAAITSALGPGFTIEKSLLIDTTTWQQSWKTALQTTNFKQFNILLKNELEHVGLHLNLFGNTEGVIYSLMEPTVDYLAEAQLLIAESFFLKDEVAQLSTRERLQKNALASLEKYQAAYRIIRQHYPKETSFQNQMQDQQSVYFAALDQFQKKRDVASALNGLKTAQQFRELILDRMDDLLFRQKKYYDLLYWTLFWTLIIGAGTVILYLILRPLTHHLSKLKNHINAMASGHFAPCFCSRDHDEFGDLGRALDEVSLSVGQIAHELQGVGRQLSDATLSITQTTHEQEFSVHGHQMQIQAIEASAQALANRQRNLADKTKEYSLGSSTVLPVDKVRTGMEHLQTKMKALVDASAKVVYLLSAVETKVNSMTGLMEFMSKVSEGANLLSLNASIETANLTKNKESFEAISQKIQRFAKNTSLSTEEIKNVVEVMSSNVSTVKDEALVCLKEINAGAQQLIEVSSQLTRITKQGKEQMAKFEQFTRFVQEQVAGTDRIIEDLGQLRESAQNNTAMIQNLHRSLDDLGWTASKLQQALDLFGSFNNKSNSSGRLHG